MRGTGFVEIVEGVGEGDLVVSPATTGHPKRIAGSGAGSGAS